MCIRDSKHQIYIRPIFHFVPLVESGICLLVDVATLSTIYDVRHPLVLPPGYPTQELISRPQAVRPPSSTPREKRNFRLFRYAYPSSSLRCSRKRPSLLSLACASGRLSFAVGERYYYVYYLSAISFHVRTYADASFHITIQARSTNTRFTYVQSSTFNYFFRGLGWGARRFHNNICVFSTDIILINRKHPIYGEP